jgi:hypothetical protein
VETIIIENRKCLAHKAALVDWTKESDQEFFDNLDLALVWSVQGEHRLAQKIKCKSLHSALGSKLVSGYTNIF